MNIQSLIGLAKGQDQSQVFLSKNQPAIEINKDENDVLECSSRLTACDVSVL